MGYNTDFSGVFDISPAVSVTDQMLLAEIHDADHRDDTPPAPGYYCQWIVSNDGLTLHWDYGEKFYDYTEWLEWLMKNFFSPKGYTVNGEVLWRGEDFKDIGKLTVTSRNVLEACEKCGAVSEVVVNDVKSEKLKFGR